MVKRLMASVSAAACVMMLSGCLMRTLTVTSEPPGALVWINDVEAGRTPLETDFTFYGVYDVRVRKEGYEPITTQRRAQIPWQEWPVVDLAMETIPVKHHTRIEWHFDLVRVAESQGEEGAVTEALVQRAKETESQLAPLPTVLPEGGAGAGPAKP